MQPNVKVGIMTAPQVHVTFHGRWADAPAECTVAEDDPRLPLTFTPADADASFTLDDVTIGVNFHWERKEPQTFRGSLRLEPGDDGGVLAINELPVEEYLKSVISSEMSATASPGLLRAHAVISRSWLLAQMRGKKADKPAQPLNENADELIRWYDHDDHSRFDVCADDHCQRYQGITRQTTPAVAEAVESTAGLVLTEDGTLDTLCDARFSKCCGGVFEEFESCWEPVHHNYLVARADTPTPMAFPDLRDEARAAEWIMTTPEAYCNTADPVILSQVLNSYDQETTRFYRWKVEYTQEQLAELVRRRSGIDFGAIRALEPVERGTSGRLVRLRIVGTRRTMVIGKELEIRRTLSESHLYSSAFIVDTADVDSEGIPGRFTLHGAGWGHGVGLCQIGAAVMGAKGIPYQDILAHYFPGSQLTKIY